MSSAQHFYVVFNPLLKPSENFLTQAHEFHHLLKEKVRSGSKENFLYWGKIKKTDKYQPLVFENYQKVLKSNFANGSDTFLYISDFNFFWVAKVEEVSLERPQGHETLDIYQNEEVELWFKITDMDLLCSHPDSTRKKIAELSVAVTSSGSKIKSLNPYIGGLRYPLIVNDVSDDDYFTKYKNKKRILVHNSLIDESLDTSLKKHHHFYYTIPEKNFEKLPPLLKKKIIWAEECFASLHEKDGDYQDKLSKIAFSYLRVLEAMLNFSLIKEIDVRIWRTNQFQDLTSIYHTLNTVSYNGQAIDELMRLTVHDKFWNFCKIDVRNFLHFKVNQHELHSIKTEELIPANAALFIRNSMLGVGCKGILNEMIERYEVIEKVVLTPDELKRVG